MKVEMLDNAIGSNCGKFLTDYVKGEIVEISEGLAKCFLQMGVAALFGEKAKEAPENKAITEGDYQNKATKPKAKKKEAE